MVSVHVSVIHPFVIKSCVFISRVYAWSLLNFTNFDYPFLTGERQRRKNHMQCRGRRSAEPDIMHWGCAREKGGRHICTVQVFLPVPQFSPVSIIPPLLYTHSFIYHPSYIIFFSQYFSFPLSVSFHHCSILIHSSTTHAV